MTDMRPGFWRWLPQTLIEAIRKTSGLMGIIKNPFLEIFIGGMAIFVFLLVAIVDYRLTMNTRVVLALCTIPSFIFLMHGIYREDYC